MVLALDIVAVTSLLFFVVGCARRIKQYASLPVHLRWELYPVPHESPQRVAHGGSYFEESDWWTKPRRFHLVGELRAMVAEIFAFDSIREPNPTLWWRTLLFHFGMYCIVAFLLLEGILLVSNGPLFANLIAEIDPVAILFGRIGLGFVLVGSLALLRRRTADRNLRDYTHLADYVHLAFIALTSLVLLAGSLAAAAPSPRTLLRGLLTFDAQLHIPSLLFAGLLLALCLLAYIPYSHMAHFIAKYFTYHAVRWDDASNTAPHVARAMAKNVAYRPTWWAAHMGSDGKKTWTEIVTTDPSQELRR
jgi:nitrate reductase gamma subunit